MTTRTSTSSGSRSYSRRAAQAQNASAFPPLPASPKLTRFACASCSKAFVSKALLDAHCLKRHENEFECGRCTKRFPTRQAVLVHEKFVHFGGLSVEERIDAEEEDGVAAGGGARGEEVFGGNAGRCHVCGDTFRNLRLHLQNVPANHGTSESFRTIDVSNDELLDRGKLFGRSETVIGPYLQHVTSAEGFAAISKSRFLSPTDPSTLQSEHVGTLARPDAVPCAWTSLSTHTDLCVPWSSPFPIDAESGEVGHRLLVHLERWYRAQSSRSTSSSSRPVRMFFCGMRVPQSGPIYSARPRVVLLLAAGDADADVVARARDAGTELDLHENPLLWRESRTGGRATADPNPSDVSTRGGAEGGEAVWKAATEVKSFAGKKLSLIVGVAGGIDLGRLTLDDGFRWKESAKLAFKKDKPLCPFCSRACKNSSRLANHIAVAHAELRFPCPVCPRTFQTRYGYDRHVATAHEDRRYACDVCKKEFRSSWWRNVHKRSVHESKNFNCRYCSEKFPTRSQRSQHIQSQHFDARYPCEVCGVSFSHKTSLSTHMTRLHAGDIVCSICKIGFPTKRARQDHNRTVHANEAHRCDKCDEEFLSARELDRHTDAIHREFLPCAKCGQLFPHADGLAEHVLIVHGATESSDDAGARKSRRQLQSGSAS